MSKIKFNTRVIYYFESFKAPIANLMHCSVFVRQIYLIRINDSPRMFVVAWRTISNYACMCGVLKMATRCSFDFLSKKVQTQRARIGNLFALSGLNALAAFILWGIEAPGIKCTCVCNINALLLHTQFAAEVSSSKAEKLNFVPYTGSCSSAIKRTQRTIKRYAWKIYNSIY